MTHTLSPSELDAYLARIGLARPGRIDFEALAAVHRAHLTSFTWEALDAFMGWPSSIDPRDAFAKMVEGRRGGWCYEMNGLLGAALAALGFRVTRLCGAVNRATDGDTMFGNHLTLRVDLDRPYLAEVGIADAISEPVPMQAGTFSQRGFTFSIAETDDGWLRFHNHVQGIATNFDFQPDRSDEAAINAAHRFLTTDPGSPFIGALAMARHNAKGYVTLRNDVMVRVEPGIAEETRLATVAQFAEVLAGVFDIDVAEPGEVWEKVQASNARAKAA